MGVLIKGLGVDRVCWGTDALWTGSPQWQIEGLRRLEIPEDMQNKFGFTPLGDAQGPVKTAIFSGNNAGLYGIEPKKAGLEVKRDRLAALKAETKRAGRTSAICATATSIVRSIMASLPEAPPYTEVPGIGRESCGRYTLAIAFVSRSPELGSGAFLRPGPIFTRYHAAPGHCLANGQRAEIWLDGVTGRVQPSW
jgi:hypothetical protein